LDSFSVELLVELLVLIAFSLDLVWHSVGLRLSEFFYDFLSGLTSFFSSDFGGSRCWQGLALFSGWI
jgi:hypothetical protein